MLFILQTAPYVRGRAKLVVLNLTSPSISPIHFYSYVNPEHPRWSSFCANSLSYPLQRTNQKLLITPNSPRHLFRIAAANQSQAPCATTPHCLKYEYATEKSFQIYKINISSVFLNQCIIHFSSQSFH